MRQNQTRVLDRPFAMADPNQIICPRCGTAFPSDQGNVSVTCSVCGQLRPDLDLTLEDDDDEGLADGLGTSAGGSTGVAHTALTEYEAGSHLLTSPVQSVPEDTSFRIDKPYVAMTEDRMATTFEARPTVTGSVGSLVLVVPALVAGMVAAMRMLTLAPDMATGSLYAVGTVLAVTLIGTVLAGWICAGVLFVLRVRSEPLLKVVFLLAAVAVGYLAAMYLPQHIQVRDDAMPGILMPQLKR